MPDIPMFRNNTGSVRARTAGRRLPNVDGDRDYVRVQVLTNAGALDRDKQLAVAARATDLVAEAGDDPGSRRAPGSC